MKKVKFFEEHKYNPIYPNHKLIESLKQKSREESLDEMDYEVVKKIIDEVYDEECYKKETTIIEEWRSAADIAILRVEEQLVKYKEKWGFKIFNEYIVRLTLYGPGGSYDWGDGKIIMKPKDEKKNLPRTIVHEIVHIGIEEVIIKKFNLNHPTKEYIVDRFMIDHFKDEFPNYQEQKFSAQVENKIKEIFEGGANWINVVNELGKVFNV